MIIFCEHFQLLEAVVCSWTSSQIHFECRKNNPQPLPPVSPNHPSPPLDWWPNQRTCYFQLKLIFRASKFCGLLDIVSWMASSKIFRLRKCNKCSSYNFFCLELQCSGIQFLLFSMTWTQIKEFLLCNTLLHVNWMPDVHWWQF